MYEVFLRKKIFHNITYMATPMHKNSCPRGYEIYNFGRPFLGHHYYKLSLSDLCLKVEKKIFKEIIFFSLHDLCGHTLAQEHLPRGVMKF